jgi:hypothetical protein
MLTPRAFQKSREQSLESVLEREIESLSGKVSHNVRHVASPERANTLLSRNSLEAVDYTRVSSDFTTLKVRVGVLSLEEHLDSLDWSNESLRDTSGSSTSSPINKNWVLLV